jgi:SAM-dependent methyltransferase
MTSGREISDREHFDSIAERYGAKDVAASSRPARRRRVERTIAAVPIEKFDRVLEVGCGAGFGAEYLCGRYRDYIGIDHSRRLIDLAREKNSGDGVRFEAASISDFDPPWHFDLVFMIGVVHHLEDAAGALEMAAGWLAPGGYLAANEPQPRNPLVRAARRVRARWDASYSNEQDEISADRLRALFEGAGLEEITIAPQGYFSTPFAEVVLRPYTVMALLARLACAVDGLLENRDGPWSAALSWNLIGCGRAPFGPPAG